MFDDAVKALAYAVSCNSQHAPAHHTLGGVFMRLGRIDQAVDSLRRAVNIKPSFAEAHSDLGSALRLAARFEEAEQSLRKALKLKPNEARTHLQLALLYKQQRRYAEAAVCCRKAVTLQPAFAEAHNELGNVLQGLGEQEEALISYRKALELRPDSVDAWTNLGLTLERVHRLEEARDSADAALTQNPVHYGANLLRARLDSRAGAQQQARERLETLLQQSLAPRDYAVAAMELGHVLDKLGNQVQAFERFAAAKDAWHIVLASTSYDTGQFLARIARLRAWFTAERVHNWGAAPCNDGLSAPVFLVGFPRSGTTLMEQILESHPHLTGSREEPLITRLIESTATLLGRPFVYPEGIEGLTPVDLHALRVEYWQLARQLIGPEVVTRRLIDKLPLNIVDLGFIHRLFPDAKIIVALRDPRDVCLSCYMQSFDLNQAMVNFLDLGSTTRLYAAVMDLWHHYRALPGLDAFVYRYEDLIDDVETTARRLLEFLGEPWDPAVLSYHETARKQYANTPSYQNVTLPIYRKAIGRWRSYAEQLAPHLGVLRPFLEEFGYK
jgi:tetratricopeptide (TPR) repeat protein